MNERIKKMPVFDLRKCNSCIVCVDTCPVDCLTLSSPPLFRSKHRYPCMANPEACIGCGRCAEDCPVEAVEMSAPG